MTKRTTFKKALHMASLLAFLSSAAVAQTPHLLKDINAGAPGSSPMDNADFLGTTMYFDANDTIHGMELWKSDGTAAGTVMVKDIVSGAAGSNIGGMKGVGSIMFFTADDGTTGSELWKTDGTAAGTVMIKDINPGAGNSYPGSLNAHGSMLYFKANDGTNGEELWKSDGTAAGTVMVKDINPGAGGDIGSLSSINGTLYFTADDGTNGMELWKTDGTAAGTVMIKDINPGAGDAFANGNSFVNEYNGSLYFWADDGTHGIELWKSDGTAAGTAMLLDINPGAANGGGVLPFNFVYNGSMYFAAVDATHGSELWKSDGTAAGTAILKDINPGMGSGHIGGFPAILNGELYFSGNDGTLGGEVWKTDGTAAGTVLVKDVNTGAASGIAFPYFLNPPGNSRFYFPADNGSAGNELWSSDGTAAGTTMTADINPGATGGLIGLNIDYGINSSLFFVANDGTTGNEVWVIDNVPSSVKQTTLAEGEVKVYPNPAKNILTVEAANYQSATAEVYNISGQLVISQPMQAKTYIPVSELASGVYLVKVKTANGVSIQKFIKE